MLHPEDLPVDPDQITEDADTILNSDSEQLNDALVIIGQLDPLDLGDDRKPKWTPEQQKLIVSANNQLAIYKAS